jgi:diphosphomevalonate decarboxylase
MLKMVVARADSNVALAKYWGKRDERLNLPHTGSLSVAMAGLTTTAAVSLRRGDVSDRIIMNGEPADAREGGRVTAFLDLVRERAERRDRLDVDVQTNFPVAAGIASSASTFAALTVAAAALLGLALSEAELSGLARRGSGSAARSVPGGYVEWLRGYAHYGGDSIAVQVAPASHWPLGIVVAVTDEGPKDVGSREGMARAAQESPFFAPWLATHDADLSIIRRGVLARDLSAVGTAAEHNCLKMHAVSMTVSEGLIYWNPATVAVIDRVRRLRAEGVQAYFTIDAGPQVKVICPRADRDAVAGKLEQVAGVRRVLLSEPGSGAAVVEQA